MGALSPMHWLIIVGVVVVLFGAKRLPDAARSLGRSARILKSEVREMGDDAPKADAQTPPKAATVEELPPVPATPDRSAPGAVPVVAHAARPVGASINGAGNNDHV